MAVDKGFTECVRVIQYRVAGGYEYGKSIRGLVKWHKEVDDQTLNRKLLKKFIKLDRQRERM